MTMLKYDPWTDHRRTAGVYTCHYPPVIAAQRHPEASSPGTDAYVVLRAMVSEDAAMVAVIWFWKNAYSGTAYPVKVFSAAELWEAEANARALGEQLLREPIPDEVTRVRTEELAIAAAKAGKKPPKSTAQPKAAKPAVKSVEERAEAIAQELKLRDGQNNGP